MIRRALIRDIDIAMPIETAQKYIAWLEKQGEQKPADKVEPKFHQGEWITNGDYTWKIIEVNSLDYILQSQDGNIVDDTTSHVDEQFHSFTIEDVKDGDVLVTHLSPEGDWIGIYKQSTGDTFKTHCYLSAVGEFVINPNRCKNHGTHGLHPATKEQRDLLFQKMKEAGYEWDSEKKELKKIEHNAIEWSEEDERILNATIKTILISRGSCEEDDEVKDRFDNELRWLESIKQRMKGK